MLIKMSMFSIIIKLFLAILQIPQFHSYKIDMNCLYKHSMVKICRCCYIHTKITKMKKIKPSDIRLWHELRVLVLFINEYLLLSSGFSGNKEINKLCLQGAYIKIEQTENKCIQHKK